MDFPHHIKHEHLSLFVGFIFVFILICWIIMGEVPPLIESESSDEEHDIFQNIIDCDLSGLSIGLSEKEVAMPKI